MGGWDVPSFFLFLLPALGLLLLAFLGRKEGFGQRGGRRRRRRRRRRRISFLLLVRCGGGRRRRRRRRRRGDGGWFGGPEAEDEGVHETEAGGVGVLVLA